MSTANQRVEASRYSMLIRWSDDDQAYLVTLPEWAEHVIGDAVTHGEIYEEAVRNGEEALQALIEWAQQEGFSLPEPRIYTLASV
jgi:predicted RNase H-like HicB family nuclease